MSAHDTNLTHSEAPVLKVTPLGFPWRTPDPFLFCVHHDDAYPKGNDALGPDAPLAGRDLGQDFEGRDGWRMYHGTSIPGFPPHPHRGFETVTIARQGYIDHFDSIGAVARFGEGDVPWLTAGKGIVHSEMFPLVNRDGGNPAELFQIWLNLPRADKLAEPHFSMLWKDQVPKVVVRDPQRRASEITVVAGRLGEARPPRPPPRSWAAREDSDVAIWTLKLAAGAQLTLPPANAGTNRTLYFFRGSTLALGGVEVPVSRAIDVRADAPLTMENGPHDAELLMLQGRPIKEPVVQHGPFVMTTREEILQTFADYQRTHFGGWPWPTQEPVHPREEGRFARHGDGRVERPSS